MGSRLHGNDGRPRVPTVIPINPELHISVIPAQEDPCTTVIPATAGIRRRRGWVPVSTGTTGGRASLPSFPSTQNFTYPSFPRRKTPAQPSFPRRRESDGGGDGFPSPRERRAAARPYRHSHQPRTSHIRHSRAGRPLHHRHSRDGGNPTAAGMGSRHARPYRHSTQNHIRHSRIPGAAGMGSRLHGNDGRPRVIPAKPELRISVIPAQEDLAQPSFPRRRESTAAGMGSRLHGNDGRQRVSATIPPPRREHTAHAPPHPCRGPCTTVIPAAYPSFPLHNRHSRDGGNPGVEGMGSRLHGNDEWHPVSAASPPLRREYIVSTFTRTGRRRVWRRRSRSGAALPCPRASPARRRRRSEPASAPSCRSGSGSRPS